MSQSYRRITAAARRYNVAMSGTRNKGADSGWQEAARNAYLTVPEIAYVARWTAGMLGGAALFAGKPGPDNTIVPLPEDHPASELVASIAGGVASQSDFLSSFGISLTVLGESWIIIRPILDPVTSAATEYDWRVLSAAEVRTQSGKMVATIDGADIEVPPYNEEAPDPLAPVAIRVWMPDAFDYVSADSPVKTSLGLIEELNLLTAAIAAIARSRITGRGILAVPKGTRFPTAPGVVGDAEDDFLDTLIEVSGTAIREPDSAAATVPIVIEVPPEVIDKIQHLTFASDIDSLFQSLRNELIRRIVIGMDVPPEIPLGMSGLSHWTAWSVTGEAIRTGINPKLALICSALTQQWLRPVLDDQGVADAADVVVWFDTANLRTAVNKAAIAIDVYNAGAISAEALRRETGFTEADAPGVDGAASEDEPETPAELPVAETEAPPTEPVASTVPARSSDDADQILRHVLDVMVYNALARLGDRIMTRPSVPRSERTQARALMPADRYQHHVVTAADVRNWGLLEGAWDRVPPIAAQHGLDPDALTVALTEYTTAMVDAQVPYDPSDLRALVAQVRNAAVSE